MRRGIARTQKRIDDLEAFNPASITKRWDPRVGALEASIEETLAAVFGHNTVEYNRYHRAAKLDNGGVIMGRPAPLAEAQKFVTDGKQSAIILLGQAVRGLTEEIQDREQSAPAEYAEAAPPGDLSKVFVVHGHDGEVKEAVARFISEKLGLEAIILHERPNKGRTIITKFREEASGVGFAVVLMTPDDLGRLHDAPELSPRARQNVVFELGFFIGALGGDRVAAVVKGDIEAPSDFDGVAYISFDKEDWRMKLGQIESDEFTMVR